MTPHELFARLREMGIRTETREHEAVFTVAQSQRLRGSIEGVHSKNLFLKDKKGRLFLVVARDEAEVDLKRLHAAIGATGRLSFGAAELLRETLGVEPGSVTPFAAVNDLGRRVTVVLDEDLLRHERMNFHPLVNTMTTTIGRADLLTFLRATGHEPLFAQLPTPPQVCAAGAPLPSS